MTPPADLDGLDELINAISFEWDTYMEITEQHFGPYLRRRLAENSVQMVPMDQGDDTGWRINRSPYFTEIG